MPYTENAANRSLPRPINVGSWWRFSRYELRGGYICPAPGARLQKYDPWEPEYPPFKPLLSLIRNVEYDFRGTFVNAVTGRGEIVVPKMDQSAIDRILKWCARYGLLGIALQQMRAVTLAPRWARPFLAKNRGPYLAAQLKQYTRASGTWFTGGSQGVGSRDVVEGELVPLASRNKDWPKPGCYVDPHYPIASTRLQGVSALGAFPLRDTWARFALNVPLGHEEVFPYPPPYSPQFWQQYAEPLIDFMGAAQTLSRALAALEAYGPRTKDQVPGDVVRARGQRLVQELLAGTNPAVEEDDGSYRIVYRSPSLLGMMTIMAVEDATRGGNMKRCVKCQAPFVSSRRARYCSPQCRVTSEQARYRATQRAAIAARLAAVVPALPGQVRERMARSLSRSYQTASRLREAAAVDRDIVAAIVARHAPNLNRRQLQEAVRGLRQ